MGQALVLPPAAQRGLRKKGRTKHKHRVWLHPLEHLAFRAARWLLGRAGMGAAYRVGEVALGLVVYFFPRHRRRGLASLEIAFGERPAAWRRRTFWASVRYLAWMLVDVLLLRRILEDPRVRAGIDLSASLAAFERDGVRTSGAVFVGSHQGSPDLGCVAFARAGWPQLATFRPIEVPGVSEDLVAERQAYQKAMVGKREFVKLAYRHLSGGGIVSLLVDQDSGRRGLWVPYFGLPASTTPMPALLALRGRGRPVYALFIIRRRPRRALFRAHCTRLDPRRSGDPDQDLVDLTARITAEVERMARLHPEQMLWLHRRWKTRPPEEGGEPRR